MDIALGPVVDLVSASVMMLVAGAFFLLWRASRAPLHLLFAAAFATLATGISTVSTSEFDLTGSNGIVDVVRIVTHTAAPLMMVLGYVAVRRSAGPSVGKTIVVAFAAAGALAAAFYLLPPQGMVSAGTTRNAFIAAHVVQFILYLSLVVLSARNLLRAPSWRRALVPLGFLAYSFSKYSWILIDLSDDERLVPFIYFWRFTMLALFVSVVLTPFLRGNRDGQA